MVKYSFLVPVYNAGADLEPCVGSLLEQTFGNFEIVLVDDGSTDKSGELCQNFAEKYQQIRAFQKPNGGAASARNFALEQAQGEYVIFVDGDDTVEPDLLETVDAVLKETPAELLIFGISFDFYNPSGKQERQEILGIRHPGVHDRGFFQKRFRELFEDNALSSACNKVFSGKRISEAHLRFREDMTMYEDLEFVLRYLQHTESFVCLEKALYHYRIPARSANKRVYELERLQHNLHALTQTMLTEPAPNESADVAAGLFLGLLLRHLLAVPYEAAAFKPVYACCEDEQLRRALAMGGTLTGREKELWTLVNRQDGRRLRRWIRNLRVKSRLRRMAGSLLRKLGLRR